MLGDALISWSPRMDVGDNHLIQIFQRMKETHSRNDAPLFSLRIENEIAIGNIEEGLAFQARPISEFESPESKRIKVLTKING